MNTEMSYHVSSLMVQQTDTDSNSADNSIKRKKLNLPNELLKDITNFKRMFSKQRKKHNICVAEPAALLDTSQRCAPKEMVARERPPELERAANLTRYATGLRRLDRAKEEHIGHLERFLAEEERVIASLRTDIEREHGAYVALKQRLCRSFARPEPETDTGLSDAVSRALREFRAVCDRAAGATGTAADDACRATVDALLSDVRSLAELARDLSRETDGGLTAEDGEVADLALRLEAAGVTPRLTPDAVTAIADGARGGGGQRSDLPALWRAVRAMCDNNGKLDAAASALERDTERLQEELCRATAEHMALGANKADKTCESIVLDEFCAVTGQMTAQQMRNLEFGRTLAVDDEQIAEEQNKIEQLKAKICRKQTKQRQLVQETDSVTGQLEEQRRRCEELERVRQHLAGDLEDATRSLGHQCHGQRAKNLRQLKVQYNQLTNTRDALKLKLQKHQQVSRTPVR